MSTAQSFSKVLVDTDVVSFFFKGDSRKELYRTQLAGKLLIISFMTVAELDRWALERNWGASRRARLERQLHSYLLYRFNRALCLKWAEVTVGARRHGRAIQTADAWIAATALLYDLPLVTHNRGDYVGVDDLTVISEG